jgi:hypothetical protein
MFNRIISPSQDLLEHEDPNGGTQRPDTMAPRTLEWHEAHGAVDDPQAHVGTHARGPYISKLPSPLPGQPRRHESKGKGSKHDNLGHGRFPSPLCAAAALAEPEMLADELFLLLEGVRVTAQSVGPKGLGDRLVRMGEAMIKAHTKIGTARSIN